MQGAASKANSWGPGTKIIFGLLLLRASSRFVQIGCDLSTGVDQLAFLVGDVVLLLMILGESISAPLAWLGAVLVPWVIALGKLCVLEARGGTTSLMNPAVMGWMLVGAVLFSTAVASLSRRNEEGMIAG